MEGAPDWDLLAVVRSCYSTTTTSSTAVVSPATDLYPPPPPPPPPQQEQPIFCPSTPTSVSSPTGVLFRFPNPFESPTTSFMSGHQDLQDICKPLICPTTSSSCTAAISAPTTVAVTAFQNTPLSSPVSSSSSSFFAARSFTIGEQPQLRRPIKASTQVVFGAPPASQPPRTKKRKNLMKKVCHVPAEGLSSDLWAWRKYGQKPIKGSPYPRGYYRCSSSKGCLARKQVERNRSDPKMFIVTYTGEHNHPMPTHRNSLAGSTRQKPLSACAAANTPEQPTCSSPSTASLSPLTEKSDSKIEEDDNEMGISDFILNDDFYVGFDKIDGEDDFPDHFSPPLEFPWLSSNSGTAAAAGGS